jgi:hypothetical protein
MNNPDNVNDQDIWYRNGMLWMVILLPLLVVVASIITITIAFTNKPQIVESASLVTTVTNLIV